MSAQGCELVDGVPPVRPAHGTRRVMLDAAGRVTLPDGWPGEVVLARLPGPCVGMYTAAAFERTAEALVQADPVRARWFLRDAVEVPVGTRRRVAIAPALRSYAQITSGEPCILAGTKDHLELWDETWWQASGRTTPALAAPVSD